MRKATYNLVDGLNSAASFWVSGVIDGGVSEPVPVSVSADLWDKCASFKLAGFELSIDGRVTIPAIGSIGFEAMSVCCQCSIADKIVLLSTIENAIDSGRDQAKHNASGGLALCGNIEVNQSTTKDVRTKAANGSSR